MSRTYETAIKIGAAISKAFKADTYSAAAALTRLGTEAKKLKAADQATESFGRLQAQLASSKAKLDAASEALQRLKAAELAAGGATKESTRWTKAGESAVKAASKEFDRASAAVGRNAAALHAAGVNTAHLVLEQDRLAASLRASERGSKALERLGGLRGSVGALGGNLRSVGNDVLRLTGLGVAAATALGALAAKTIRAGDEIGDTADKLGIGSTALQELRYGALQSGAETEALDRGLAKLAISLGKVAAARNKGGAASGLVGNVGEIQILGNAGAGAGAGKGALADPFKHIGLSVKELVALKPEQQVGKIADGLLTLKTHADRAATAQAIFGKGATAILPFLEEGSAGIDRMSKAGHRFGGILGEEAVKAADLADKSLKNAELAFAGVSNTLGAALLPSAVKALDGFSNLVAENRGEIKKWAEQAAVWIEKRAIPSLLHIGREAKTLGEKVIGLVQKGASLVGGFKNLAIVVGALRLAPLAYSIGSVGVNAVKAAIAVGRYVAAKWSAVAATKALNAAEGAGIPGSPGAAGRAIGLAANAAMVAGAAVVGWEIGTKIDEALKISQKTGGKLGETGLETNAEADETLRRVAGVAGLGALAEGFIGLRKRDLAARNAELDRAATQRGSGGTVAIGQVHVHVPAGGEIGHTATAKKHAEHTVRHLAERLKQRAGNDRRLAFE
jgi:hypothetical protein